MKIFIFNIKAGSGTVLCSMRLMMQLLLLICLILSAKDLPAADTISPSVLYYQEQVTFIDNEIKNLQEELEWLTIKVKFMKDSGRFVPQRMHDSIAFKKSKIDSLEKLEKRYQNLIMKLRKKDKDKDKEKKEKPEDNHTEEPKLDQENILSYLGKQVIATGLDNWMEVVSGPLSARLENRLPILFASASADIPNGYDTFFKNLAALIKDHDVRVIIDGYADTDPIQTPRYPSNFELGAARAAAVVHSLVKCGVKPEVFKIGSTGQYRFEARKVTEWKNLQRHVDITIVFRQ